MTTPLNALLVEDSADDAALLARELQKNGFDLKWKRIETEADYRANLNSELSLIFSDFALPQFSTMRALAVLQESKLEIPFIIVSGTIGEERAVESMKAGATDYVLKDNLSRIGPVVRRALREIQERVERKQAEARFLEAQKMEVIGQLAGGVAHDFNNILTVIIGYGDWMISELDSKSVPHKCAVEIRQAAERAVVLTRQLLVFSHKQIVQPVVLDLNDVVKDLSNMLRRLIDENVELTIVPGKETGRIKADSGQVGQVLMNLIVNARDAMPNGGKLTVETGNVTLDENFARFHVGVTAGDYVMLAVIDTGTGMTDEVKARLFEAFFTTKQKGKGTGLGLATCETIVKQCGGYIEVKSEWGKGTAFKVYFPRIEQLVATAVPPAREESLARGTETVLVVEDEPSLRDLTCNFLVSLGYHVLSANNGEEGLRMARECKDEPIRLVITDVIMPQMSGNVMAEWLKEVYPDLKILFTSGYTDDALGKHGVMEPGIVFLPKPYTPVALAHKVREMLDHKSDHPPVALGSGNAHETSPLASKVDSKEGN
jgi:two-component system, cell cycle sensor histidine kinase and response regulator CckA